MSSVVKECKETQRRDNWDDGEVRILLEVCGDDRVQADLEGTSRNKRTAESCRSKIKSLQQSYTKCKDNNK